MSNNCAYILFIFKRYDWDSLVQEQSYECEVGIVPEVEVKSDVVGPFRSRVNKDAEKLKVIMSTKTNT